VAIFTGWQRKARLVLSGQRDIDLDHAGQSETSLTLYAAPDAVRMGLASKQPRERFDHPVDLVGSYEAVAPLGYSGNPTAASPAEGEAIVAALVSLVVPHLKLLDEHGWRAGAWLSGVG
jgi:creatinine amidohydrolase/Fe(II)-dependent formamide hydrolase-like protein